MQVKLLWKSIWLVKDSASDVNEEFFGDLYRNDD